MRLQRRMSETDDRIPQQLAEQLDIPDYEREPGYWEWPSPRKEERD
jgi:hypothetical protein